MAVAVNGYIGVLPDVEVAVGIVHVVVGHVGIGVEKMAAHTVGGRDKHSVGHVGEVERGLAVGIESLGGEA